MAGRGYLHTYPNGDRAAIVSVVFRCRPRDDSPPCVNDSESLDVGYFAPDDLPPNLIPRHRRLIAKALENRSAAYFQPNEA